MMYRSAKNRTAKISASRIAMDLTTGIPDPAFSAVWFCSYTARRTQFDRPY